MLIKRGLIALIASVFVALLVLPSMAYAEYYGEETFGGDPWSKNWWCLFAIDYACNRYLPNWNIDTDDVDDVGVRDVASELDWKMANCTQYNLPPKEGTTFADLLSQLGGGVAERLWNEEIQPLLKQYPDIEAQLRQGKGKKRQQTTNTTDEPTGEETVVDDPVVGKTAGGGGGVLGASSGSNNGGGGTNNARNRTYNYNPSQPQTYTSPTPDQPYAAPVVGQDPSAQTSAITGANPVDPNQPAADPNQPAAAAPGEAGLGEDEVMANVEESVAPALSPISEESAPALEQVSAIAAALATNEVVRAGVVALPILLITLFGAFLLTGSEDYRPRTRLMKKIMEWRRRKKGEPEKGQPMFDERAYYDNGLGARGKNGKINALGNGHRLQ